MATLCKRKNKDGTISYRVQIRRKSLRFISCTFANEEKALKFIKKYEEKYVLDGHLILFDKLKNNRENEFDRKRENERWKMLR